MIALTELKEMLSHINLRVNSGGRACDVATFRLVSEAHLSHMPGRYLSCDRQLHHD